jgi:hypothetical protein
MDERFRRGELIEQRAQMLLGIFASHGLLPLEFSSSSERGRRILVRPFTRGTGWK